MPLLGRASDRFGRKLVLQVSLAGFAIGSVVTALSTDLTMLVVGRAIQGIASGALLPVTLALAADLWAARNRAARARRHRRRAGAGQRARPAVRHRGGLGCSTTGSDVFWINVPLAVIAMVMIHFSLPSQPKRRDAREGRRGRRRAAGGRAGSGRRRAVQPRAGRQAGAAELRPAAADRRARRRGGVLRVGALRPHPADRTRRRALPAVPGRAGRLADAPARR